jgi:diguanylate cyclase (GGDEF)-like protein
MVVVCIFGSKASWVVKAALGTDTRENAPVADESKSGIAHRRRRLRVLRHARPGKLEPNNAPAEGQGRASTPHYAHAQSRPPGVLTFQRRLGGDDIPEMTPSNAEELSLDVLTTMRRVGIVMFVIGSVTAVSVVFTAEATWVGRISQSAVAVGYVACALALSVSRSRLWPVQASLATSIVLLSVGTATARPIGLGPLFYLWPLVYAAYFFTPRALVLNFALMVSSLAIALILNASATHRADTLIRTSVSVGMIAALVLFMRLREARLRGELATLADTDPLTGLLNRRAFDPRLLRLAEGAARDGTPLAVALIDVDRFKRVNDERGHIAGDEVLKRVTSVLLASLSPDDVAVRQGGDEFVVALVGRELPAAVTWAKRIADDLRRDPAGSGAITLYRYHPPGRRRRNAQRNAPTRRRSPLRRESGRACTHGMVGRGGADRRASVGCPGLKTWTTRRRVGVLCDWGACGSSATVSISARPSPWRCPCGWTETCSMCAAASRTSTSRYASG